MQQNTQAEANADVGALPAHPGAPHGGGDAADCGTARYLMLNGVRVKVGKSLLTPTRTRAEVEKSTLLLDLAVPVHAAQGDALSFTEVMTAVRAKWGDHAALSVSRPQEKRRAVSLEMSTPELADIVALAGLSVTRNGSTLPVRVARMGEREFRIRLNYVPRYATLEEMVEFATSLNLGRLAGLNRPELEGVETEQLDLYVVPRPDVDWAAEQAQYKRQATFGGVDREVTFRCFEGPKYCPRCKEMGHIPATCPKAAAALQPELAKVERKKRKRAKQAAKRAARRAEGGAEAVRPALEQAGLAQAQDPQTQVPSAVTAQQNRHIIYDDSDEEVVAQPPKTNLEGGLGLARPVLEQAGPAQSEGPREKTAQPPTELPECAGAGALPAELGSELGAPPGGAQDASPAPFPETGIEVGPGLARSFLALESLTPILAQKIREGAGAGALPAELGAPPGGAPSTPQPAHPDEMDTKTANKRARDSPEEARPDKHQKPDPAWEDMVTDPTEGEETGAERRERSNSIVADMINEWERSPNKSQLHSEDVQDKTRFATEKLLLLGKKDLQDRITDTVSLPEIYNKKLEDSTYDSVTGEMDTSNEPVIFKQMARGARLWGYGRSQDQAVDVELDMIVYALKGENQEYDVRRDVFTLNTSRYEAFTDLAKTSLCKQLAFRCKGRQETPPTLVLPKRQQETYSNPEMVGQMWAQRMEIAASDRLFRGLKAMGDTGFTGQWNTDIKPLRVDGDTEIKALPSWVRRPVFQTMEGYWKELERTGDELPPGKYAITRGEYAIQKIQEKAEEVHQLRISAGEEEGAPVTQGCALKRSDVV